MSLPRPSLAQLWQRISAYWQSQFPGADTNAENSPDRAWVGVIARSTDEDMSFLVRLAAQLFPFSATQQYLERWASYKKVYRIAASAGSGVAGAPAGAGVPTSVAVAGTQMTDPNGNSYQLSQPCEVATDGSIVAQVAAVLPTGATDGSPTNLGIGVVLSFVGTPAGFPDTLTVSSVFAGGAPAETDPQLAKRTQLRYSQPSFGGNGNDWRNATLAIPGVTRCFVQAATPTPGAVTIYPLFDNIRTNGIPSGTNAWIRPGTAPSSGTGGAGDQLMVLNTLLGTDTPTPRPICASVYVNALVPQALNWTIIGLVIAPGTTLSTVQAAIALSIATMLLAKATPGGTIDAEWVNDAIADTAGVVSYDLVVPASDVTMPNLATIAVAGTGTYE